MKVIYKPKGKALEYAPWAANLYKGCDHGCVYCYAPGVKHMDRETFGQVDPLTHKLADMEDDLKKNPHLKKEGPVLLSFTTDPYNNQEPKERITHRAIKLCNRYDVGVAILTKGGSRSYDDIKLLAKNKKNLYGASLTLRNRLALIGWEPNAALYSARVKGLYLAHDLGIKTFVSMEPVIDPAAALEIIEETAPWVDLFKVGKLNYHPLAKDIDWGKFHDDVTALLTRLGKEFYIKKDLIDAATGAGAQRRLGMEG